MGDKRSAMKLILIRGLPGSGKSTLARNICFWASSGPNYFTWRHYEADMFFVKKDVYQFDAMKTHEAHAWCKQKVADALVMNENVVVSNTFTRIWEMQPYLDLGKEFGAEVTVLTCEGDYGNVHGVPDDVIEKMRKRWEQYRG